MSKKKNTDRSKSPTVNQTRLMIYIGLFFLIGFFIAKFCLLYRLSGKNIVVLMNNKRLLFDVRPQLLAFSAGDLVLGAAVAGIVILCIHDSLQKRKKFKSGEEYGSAHWGTRADIAPFIDPVFYNNLIFSATEFLSMRPHFDNPLFNRNKHVEVIGGSGSGKTRFFVLPNLMQMYGSYVVTDPKGTVLPVVGKLLRRGVPKKDKNGKVCRNKRGRKIYEPYEIKVLNTINFAKSMHYNPFSYVKCEADILSLGEVFFKALKKDDTGQGGDPFWDDAALLFIQACFGYIYYYAPAEEQNINTFMEMLRSCQVSEDDENAKSALDFLFEEIENSTDEDKGDGSFAVRQWMGFKMAAGKTAKSVLIIVYSKFSPFNIREVSELMKEDELELDTVGDRRTALFIITSDTKQTYSFISKVLYMQLFDMLCYKADNEYDGELPYPVMCLMDEFANLGRITDFEVLIATLRSRGIGVCPILQTASQLKSKYKDDAETISGNCDTTIFLGGKEKTTLKDLEEALGEETIDLFNESDSRGTSQSKGINYQKLGHKLKSVFELNIMPRDRCIVRVNGVPPFFSKKFDITSHPRYKFLSYADKKNYFDVDKYIESRRGGSSNEVPKDMIYQKLPRRKIS